MKSLQAALHACSFDPFLARLAAALPWPDVKAIARLIAESDAYREAAHLRRAFEVAGSGDAAIAAHIEHQVWAAWRQAHWSAGSAHPLPTRVEGEDWLRETEGRPTVLIAPMTLAPADAVHAMAAVQPPGRAFVVFGEDAELPGPELAGKIEIVTGDAIVGMSQAAIRRIIRVLDGGGVLCTYADFVYDGRIAEAIPLFGTARPAASGFISLAARNGTMLLPLVCTRDGDGVIVHFEEALEIRNEAAADPAAAAAARRQAADAIGVVLETLIRRAPEQWLLLPTLTFDSPQMALVAAQA